jgi:RHS repeat-associated protein
MSYDKNGNISSIFRSGFPSGNYEIAIDNLQFTNQGNQLTKVSDTSNNKAGFKDGNTIGDDYSYDANGNMIVDKNKGITKIVYNHLNLPVLIEFNNSSTKKITYLYNANGVKVRKWVWNSDYIPIRTDYLDGFQYKNELLQYFPTSEGYVNNTVISGVNTYKYVYNYTDHLGNVRLSYQDINKDGIVANSEILEESNYYPFGMKHSGYNSGNLQVNYKYKFQGTERQDELGLNWDSYKYRNYDYAIGRFMSIDPLTEEYHTWSPYVFSGNRVVDARELEGLEPYLVTGRAFIPDKTLPNPAAVVSNTKSFAGDNRSDYRLNTNAYRTEQKVRVDFENQTATTLSNRANSTIGYGKDGKVTETSEPGTAGPTPTYTKSTMKDGTTTVNMEVDASNKLVSGAPAINYKVGVTITEGENGSFSYKIEGKSDGFPAYEFFITNEKNGKSYLIHGSNPNSTGDTPSSLFPPMDKKINASGNSTDLKPIEVKK